VAEAERVVTILEGIGGVLKRVLAMLEGMGGAL
jgi:hypothetical protein